jgi:glucosamine-phosphate N-acetyltransferase|uniref:N-acetyltransferase domain-containing protein n=1 Tax=viral metagenome TaxID=1070528 RepID=A0A6C0EQ63_9ZZZZ
MVSTQYNTLLELIKKYPDYIEIIKNKYLYLLSNLTTVEDISNEMFIDNINKIHNIGCIIVAYIKNEDASNINIIGSGTVIIEPKILRGCKSVGHIEDIVVDLNHRGKHICRNILHRLKLYARENNCYKVILDCEESVKNVYIKSDFQEKGLQMAVYFN